MRFKDGVDRRDVSPVVWWYLPTAERLHLALVGEELVVTSMRRPWGSPAHNPPAGELVRAADLRRWYLDRAGAGVARAFVDTLNAYLAPHCRVLLEPEDLSEEAIAERGGLEKIAPHIHLQAEHEEFKTLWF